LLSKFAFTRTVADERNSVIGSPAQPCLHRRCDVDENILVLVGRVRGTLAAIVVPNAGARSAVIVVSAQVPVT
jgi:hypothetical protein